MSPETIAIIDSLRELQDTVLTFQAYFCVLIGLFVWLIFQSSISGR